MPSESRIEDPAIAGVERIKSPELGGSECIRARAIAALRAFLENEDGFVVPTLSIDIWAILKFIAILAMIVAALVVMWLAATPVVETIKSNVLASWSFMTAGYTGEGNPLSAAAPLMGAGFAFNGAGVTFALWPTLTALATAAITFVLAVFLIRLLLRMLQG